MNYIYSLDCGVGNKNQLGNKGANLVTMTKIGLPVPPAFVVSIEAYKEWVKTGKIPDDQIDIAMAGLEKQMSRKLGKGLEVSVRSSAPVSMPGMMDTLLNIGDMARVKSAIKTIF